MIVFQNLIRGVGAPRRLSEAGERRKKIFIYNLTLLFVYSFKMCAKELTGLLGDRRTESEKDRRLAGRTDGRTDFIRYKLYSFLVI